MTPENLLTLELSEILSNLQIQHQVEGIAVLHNAYENQNHSIESKFFRSQHFSVIIVTKGKLNLNINLFKYELAENDLIIIPPSAIKQFSFQNKVEYFALLFTPQYLFDSGFFQKQLQLFSFFDSEVCTKLSLSGKDAHFTISTIELIQEKLKHSENTKTQQSIIVLLFQAIILHLISFTETEEKQIKSIYQKDLVYRFLTLLPKSFKENREVHFYAQKLNVNPKYLTQILRKKTGKSARDFITEMVVMEAKVLLDHPKNTIGNIAEQLNFSDQFHFSHFFKKYTGHSPLQYRHQEN
ncbi:MAG TPA: helix-turn-helix domain-containing protein [Niabella sp.]|nr:helix-turn-helix domain-containing protein [Niabella sp.]HQW14104.1 helix-turn-helix domain-containing protein [Niabella sp.]HQX19353.1 helix-turn-helix domain-containing protein [Niabella sp.]HQX41789.1 helix-turn-helix domain-containing protein [Niabella sp.]HRB05570.1 helix-turn-helix domain-containing protein [Niabella sp.]